MILGYSNYVTVNELEGQYATDKHYDTIIRENYEMRDSKSKCHIFTLYKNVIDKEVIKNAFKAVEKHTNRVTGLRKPKGTPEYSNKVRSNVIGYFVDNIGNNTITKNWGISKPYKSNITAWNRKNPELFESNIMPLMRSLYNVYHKFESSIAELHMKHAKKTEFHIDGTPWSTITVNRDWQSHYHKDSNNYSLGLGNLVVYEGSKYEGGYLVFPEYRVAVDVRMGDVLIMNQFCLQGNTPIIKENPDSIGRVSFVTYLHNGLMEDLKNNPTIADYYRYLYEIDEAKYLHGEKPEYYWDLGEE